MQPALQHPPSLRRCSKVVERKFHWPPGRRPDEHPALSDLGLSHSGQWVRADPLFDPPLMRDGVRLHGTEPHSAKPAAKIASTAKPSAGKVDKKPTKLRPVLVRDSFTMPETDFALIATLKATALGARRAAKKSELLRAGLRVLAGLDAESLVVLLDRLETVKTGRPKKGH
jgi:hypothetical protein